MFFQQAQVFFLRDKYPVKDVFRSFLLASRFKKLETSKFSRKMHRFFTKNQLFEFFSRFFQIFCFAKNVNKPRKDYAR